MHTIFKKILKDNWQQKTKVIYLFFALLLAAFGISTLYYANLMAAKDFEVNFARSNPANIILDFPNNTAIPLHEIKLDPMISEVEKRPLVLTKIQVAPSEFMSVLVIGVEDIQAPKLNKFNLISNTSPSKNIYIEKNGTYFFDQFFLDNITIINKEQDTLRLGKPGLIHDGRLPPSRMERTIYIYLPLSNFERYFGTTNRLLLKTVKEYSDRAPLYQIANKINKNLSAKYGISAQIGIPPPMEHPHQNIVDGVFYILQLLGGSWILMGWVFMILILFTWLYPQMQDIGTMKSLGANQKNIQQAYLLFIFLIAAFAFIVGAIGGRFMGQAFNGFIAFTQNFVPVDNPISFSQQLILAIIAIGTPVLMGLFPILTITKKSTRHAQNMVFNTHDQSLHWLNQLLPTTQLKYVTNNLFKNVWLFLLTIILATIGLSLTFSGFNLSHSLNSELTTLEEDKVFDYMAIFNRKYKSNEKEVVNLDFVKTTKYAVKEEIRIEHPLLDVPKELMLLYLDSSIHLSNNRMVLGEWEPNCYDCLYITQNLGVGRDFDQLPLGSNLTVQINNNSKRTLKYAGIVKIPEIYSSAFIPTKTIENWNILFINGGLKGDQSTALTNYFHQIWQQNPSISAAANIRLNLKNHLEGGFFIISSIGIAALGLSLLSIVILINLMLIRRKKEIGILKSIGASKTQIKILFLKELMFVVIITIFFASLLSLYLSYSMCFHYGRIVFKSPFLFSFHWLYNIISLVIYMLLIWISVNYQLQKRLTLQSRFLLN